MITHRLYVYNMNIIFAKTKCTIVDDRWISATDLTYQGHAARNKSSVHPDDSHRDKLIINLRLSEIFLICLESFSWISSDCCHCCRVQSRNGIFYAWHRRALTTTILELDRRLLFGVICTNTFHRLVRRTEQTQRPSHFLFSATSPLMTFLTHDAVSGKRRH